MSLQQKKDGISLRVLYIWIIIGALIISALMFYSTYSLTSTFSALTEATENQMELDKASHELMEASDYLTERVQRFTINGDRRYMDEYFTEAFETKRREEAIETMSGDPSVADALKELKQAQEDSNELMDREYYAMRLVCDAKGYTDIPEEIQSVELNKTDSALIPEDKMRHATEMVLDEEYYEQKDRIRSDMKESLYTLESLTRNTERSAFTDVRNLSNMIRMIIVLQIAAMLFLVWLTIHLGIQPILNAVKRIKEDRPVQETGATEFRYLARAYNNLSMQLNQENEKLKALSQTDALTGLRNRLALRSDYDSYQGHEITVMIMDLDDFKHINDTCGHEEGDRILSETGKLLADTFGKEYCYRFGGDEFLVIVPDEPEDNFVERLHYVIHRGLVIEKDGKTARVGYSAGYVHSILDDNNDLRKLFAEADKKMYEVKRDKMKSGDLTDRNAAAQ